MNVDTRTILLVEDSEDDAFIFTRAFKHAHLTHPVEIARDGRQALDRLLGQGDFGDRSKYPVPFLVFLDLKVPLKSGHELLQAIRSAPALAGVSVVVLTSSAEVRDIMRAQELGAQAFLVKPPAPATLAAAVAATLARLEAPLAPVQRFPCDMFENAKLTGERTASPPL